MDIKITMVYDVDNCFGLWRNPEERQDKHKVLILIFILVLHALVTWGERISICLLV